MSLLLTIMVLFECICVFGERNLVLAHVFWCACVLLIVFVAHADLQGSAVDREKLPAR